MCSLHPDHPSFYANAFLHAPIGIAIASVHGEWAKVNRALCNMLGYDEDELSSLDYRTIARREDLLIADQLVQDMLEGGSTSCSLEVRYWHKSGRTVWISQHMSLIRDEIGNPQCFYIHFTDMTRQRQSNQLYSVITEHSLDIISFNSPEGVCLYISPAVRYLLGYYPEELVGKQHLDYVHPEDKAYLMGRTYSDTDKITYRYRHADGHYVWFETTMKFIRDAQGKVETTLAIGRDISERIKTEQALENSRRNLAEAQKIASIGSWEWDLLTNDVVWSEELMRICDIEPEVFCGKFEKLITYIHPDDLDMVLHNIKRAREGQPYNLECRILTSTSTDKYVHIQGIVIYDSHNKPYKMHGTVQDITERYKMQQLLEETIDRYTSLKKYNPDGIISLDKQGYIVSANPAAQTISGYSAQELVQLHFTDLLHPDDMIRALAWYEQFLQGEMTEREDLSIKHKDGRFINLLITPAPIIIRQQIVGCYIVVKDITDQKKTDELLRQSEKLSVVGQLAAGVAHEIRNPLTALKGFVKLMMYSEHSFPRYLAIMKEELERIELIVSELLMLSKPQTTNLRCMNLKEVLEEVQALIGTQAIMKNIDIQLDAEGDLFPVYCDPNQIKQVFINFIKNGIEAMNQEGVIRIHLSDDSECFTRVQIIDEGCGIPEDKLPRLGEPFFTTKEGGTGLGLMISQKIIEHHGGTMSIYSQLNVGTTVEVCFPTSDIQLEERRAVRA
ncbi:PAS domain S-box protein [Paenibacillus sp. NPDC056579]|uniref:PAS domain S-box protein n=1 Tax=Paenibacillus sp. NPDC056579 TaxID=3345871 RepID=UPI0036BDAB54